MSAAPDNLEDGTIDAGLYLLDLIRKPENIYSRNDLAIVCGTTPYQIAIIEKRAMEKINEEFKKRAAELLPQPPPAYIPPRMISLAIQRGNYDNRDKRNQNNF